MNLRTVTVKTRFLLLLPVFITLIGCAENKDVLPKKLGELNLTKVIQGKKATAIINKMHGKVLGASEYIIGYYGGDQSGNILYLSLFENEDAARKDLMDMSIKMAGGTPVFTPLTFEETDGGIHLRTEGMGFVHYFYRNNRVVIWWQVTPDQAEATYRDLLNFDFRNI